MRLNQMQIDETRISNLIPGFLFRVDMYHNQIYQVDVEWNHSFRLGTLRRIAHFITVGDALFLQCMARPLECLQG